MPSPATSGRGTATTKTRTSSVGKFDFVMANPPFNVDKVDKEKIKDDPRFPFGMPKADNANYLWIQLFYQFAECQGPGRVRHGEFRR